MPFYLQGLTMGLAYVAPIGLQNIFVINSAMSSGFPKALLTSFIVIFFDVSLALACFFGIGAIMGNIIWLQRAILLIGSIIVMLIGIRLVIRKPAALNDDGETRSLAKTITSACIVSWFNPQAIIDGTMMLGAFHASLPEEGIVPFISGAASASFLWFLSLTLSISIFSRHIPAKALKGINIICGMIITIYGVKLFANFFSL